MDIRPLTDTLSVSPQITAADLQAVHDAGFTAIVCNRPDGEGVDQPNFGEIERAAQALGLQAQPLMAARGVGCGDARYDGYGSCPLTVARGKIVLAGFTDSGKLAPSFPKWLIDGTRPSTLAWLLKERILPPLYRDGMLKGREWMAQPEMVG